MRRLGLLERPLVPGSTVDGLVRAGVDPDVARISLERVKEALAVKEQWDQRLILIGESEYKRFLTLVKWNQASNHVIVPTRLMDEVWHRHILDTSAYAEDTQRVLGYFLEHYPYLGMSSASEQKFWSDSFTSTVDLYRETFGESPIRMSESAGGEDAS